MKKIKSFLIILILFICLFATQVFADVGSFEDYSGGSSWDSGSSWSSSSWDDDYSSSGSGGFFIFSGPGGIIILIVIVILAVYSKKHKNNHPYDYIHNRKVESYRMQDKQQLEAREKQIENKIQQTDPNFNKEEFVAWSKNLFIKLQQAWTDRDWETIRTFETESLFEQHKNQLQGYIDNNQINVMDRICVNYANLYNYREEGDKEILVVRLNSRMEDYIIDATTKEVLKGEKGLDKVNTYLLTFIRKKGVKTQAGTTQVNTTNCPNCGAPTKITSAGRCEYCGSVITTGEYNWVLSNLERENVRL
mgnify:FL=1